MKKGIVPPLLLLLASTALILGAFFVLDNKLKTDNQDLTQKTSPSPTAFDLINKGSCKDTKPLKGNSYFGEDEPLAQLLITPQSASLDDKGVRIMVSGKRFAPNKKINILYTPFHAITEFGELGTTKTDKNGEFSNLEIVLKTSGGKFAECNMVIVAKVDTKETADSYPKRAEALFINTPVVASTWKTYTNTQFGFEFKYPQDWSFEDYYKKYPAEKRYMKSYIIYEVTNPNNRADRTDYLSLSIQAGRYEGGTAGFIGNENSPINDFFNVSGPLWLIGGDFGGGPGTTFDDAKKITIGGKQAVTQQYHPTNIYEFASPDQISKDYIIPFDFSLHDIVYISLRYSTKNKAKDEFLRTFDQILSTFKFTN